MDLHDLGRGFASYESGVLRIQCPVLIIGFDSDLLFPCYQQKEIADILRPRNRQVYYREIHTIYGHDAFLLEIEQISETIREFFSTINL
jgi:homoserine O-acetyltransferase